MKDALDAVQEFTYELDTNKNGKINSCTMKEMWDYKNGTMGPAKRKIDSDPLQKGSIILQVSQFMSCELCGGNHNHENCPHESQFSQLGEDANGPNLGFNIKGREIK